MNRFQVHAPYDLLIKHLDLLFEMGLNPEIYFSGPALDGLEAQQAVEVAAELDRRRIRVTFHAPFRELSPGSEDSRVRRASCDRLEEALNLAASFRPRVIVCHTGLYGSSSDLDDWLEWSLSSWRPLISLAEKLKTVIALENVYEGGPESLERLLSSIDSPHFGFCLDIGHVNVYSTVPLERWLTSLGRWLVEVHLHDNHGKEDEHLPMGMGNIDYRPLFAHISRQAPRPIFTLEPMRKEDLEGAIEGFGRLTPRELL